MSKAVRESNIDKSRPVELSDEASSPRYVDPDIESADSSLNANSSRSETRESDRDTISSRDTVLSDRDTEKEKKTHVSRQLSKISDSSKPKFKYTNIKQKVDSRLKGTRGELIVSLEQKVQRKKAISIPSTATLGKKGKRKLSDSQEKLQASLAIQDTLKQGVAEPAIEEVSCPATSTPNTSRPVTPIREFMSVYESELNVDDMELPVNPDLRDVVPTLEEQRRLLDRQQSAALKAAAEAEKTIRPVNVTVIAKDNLVTASAPENMEIEPVEQSLGSYQAPRKTSKIGQLCRASMATLTKNRFSVLATETAEEIMEKAGNSLRNRSVVGEMSTSRDDRREEVSGTSRDSLNDAQRSKRRRVDAGETSSSRVPANASDKRGANKSARTSDAFCPPIVLQGKPPYKDLVEDIKTHVKKGFYIKYAKRSVLVFIKDRTEHVNYRSALLDASTPPSFHTYTLQGDKTHAFVLRGIHGDPEIQEIKNDLVEEHNLNIVNVFRMKTKFSPLYLVVTDDKTTLNYLQKNVRFVMNVKVSWERRQNTNIISQCRRCQGWGHSATNCYRDPHCLKCGEGHLTTACTHPVTDPPKCANCAGEHLANDKECPVYLFRISKLPSQQEKQQELVSAPPPQTNVWQERSRAAREAAATARSGARDAGAAPRTARDAQPLPPSQDARRVPAAATEAPVDDAALPMRNLQSLTSALDRLNNIMDMTNATTAVNILADMVEAANSDLDAVNAMSDFARRILPQYPILRRRPN